MHDYYTWQIVRAFQLSERKDELIREKLSENLTTSFKMRKCESRGLLKDDIS